MFVSLFLTVTVAPATAAPLGSVTEPDIVPRNSCADAEVAAAISKKVKTMIPDRKSELTFIFSSCLFWSPFCLWN
jgi:hypothetical protein